MNRAILEGIYTRRPCFICNQRRWCVHREPRIAWAEFQAAGGRLPPLRAHNHGYRDTREMDEMDRRALASWDPAWGERREAL